MLVENTLFGERDKIKIAIDRLQAFEPPEGYYLCFSGGKDSQTIYHLAKEAKVKFDAHYSLTTIDPPELVYFIREHYPDVIVDKPQKTMLQLIEEKGLPTRFKRFCCSSLKETGGGGRICITGVRWAESTKRAKRKPFEIVATKRENAKLFNDNTEDRKLFENCMQKGKRVINPIIDWFEDDVWEYLNSRCIPHCCLYDEGKTRIGCIGCPLATSKHMKEDFKRYPKYLENYKRAFAKFLHGYLKRCEEKNRKPAYKTVEEWFAWWLGDINNIKEIEGQIDLFESDEEE